MGENLKNTMILELFWNIEYEVLNKGAESLILKM